MKEDVERLVSELQLIPHPEGGYYRETHRSSLTVALRDGSQRSALTGIYFLLTSDAFSAWHRIDADESWHFYRGADIIISVIGPDGSLEGRRLGESGPWQTTVNAGSHFAAHVPEADAYALVGCSVAPGFEFAAFELPSRAVLIEQYPNHAGAIRRFTRD